MFDLEIAGFETLGMQGINQCQDWNVGATKADVRLETSGAEQRQTTVDVGLARLPNQTLATVGLTTGPRWYPSDAI